MWLAQKCTFWKNLFKFKVLLKLFIYVFNCRLGVLVNLKLRRGSKHWREVIF